MSRALDLSHAVADRVAWRISHGGSLLDVPSRAPPGPRGSVVLGTFADGWSRPLDLFAEGARGYGPIVRYRFGASFYYQLNDPELVQRVFVENAKNYTKSRYYRGIRLVLGDGLFTSEGDLWRRQRRLAQPGFHRERLAGFAAIMADSTRAAIEGLRARAGETVDAAREMSRLALRIVGRTLFSADIDGDADEIGRAVHFANEFGESAYFLPLWVPTRRNRELKRALAVFDGLVARMIAERRSGRARDEARRDLLSMLMAARDEESGEAMSDRQLRDEALTLIIGGHETTATVLDWTFYLLSRHPEVERRLRAHVVSVLGDRDPTPDDLPRLGYVSQVVQESMRLYPPAWVIEREAIADDALAGYRVPAGSTLAVCPYVLHRDPRFWPNPEGFDPDRFAPERLRDRPKHAYLPFGHGPRQCIGNAFAAMETTIIVSMFVRAMSLELAPGHKMEPDPLTTLRPRYGLKMVPRVVAPTA